MAQTTIEKFQHFIDIVHRLRNECPWDSTQTHESLGHLLIEETYETLDAIQSGDFNELKKELGDILLHVVLHAVIASETKRFDLDEVLDLISEKLIRRHPHIFANQEVSGVKEVIENWETIKMKEGRNSVLEGVPDTLPALLQAYRIQDKVAGLGFDWNHSDDVWKKVEEELNELKAASANHDDFEHEMGDLLFSLTNFARHFHVNPETALHRTNKKFKRRFQFVEKQVRLNNMNFKDLSLEQLDLFWDQAKAEEKKSVS